MLLNKFEKDGFINEPFEMKCLFCYNDNTYIQGKLVRTGKDYPLEIKLYIIGKIIIIVTYLMKNLTKLNIMLF